MSKIVYEELPISNDFMFSKVMRDEKTCRMFLETVLGFKISKIDYIEPQKTMDGKVDARSVRFDIYAESGDIIYDCEMQVVPKRNLPKRCRYYHSMMDMNLIRKGEDYIKLKTSFVIFICTYDPFGEGFYKYTYENRCRETGKSLDDGNHTVFLNTKGAKGNVPDEFKKLMEFFNTSILNERTETELTKRMSQLLQAARNREDWRNECMSLEMMLMEKFSDGRTEGREEGRIEGRTEENRRINSLNQQLILAGRWAELEKATNDPEYQEILLKEYGLF